MHPMLLSDLTKFLGTLLDGAMAKWDEGLVPFFTSPYGIFVLFVAMFVFLNSMRMRL